MPVLAAVPVKRFYVAKGRLSPILDAASRSRLGQALATHTLETVAQVTEVLVLAADAEVEAWATARGWSAMVDDGGGLDGAAGAAAARAASSGRSWLIVHADLPLLTKADIAAAIALLDDGASPIAPADDGGTSLVGGRGSFRFSYGPGSFHRHLARLTDGVPLVRPGLALDLDGPADFAAALRRPRGEWLRRYPARL